MSLAGKVTGAVVAGAPALSAASAVNGKGAARAGTAASAACPALADEAGCPAGVVVGTAAPFIIISAMRSCSSRRSLSSLAPVCISA
eukprot:8078333-Pyramimonas_sp.AAC.1